MWLRELSLRFLVHLEMRCREELSHLSLKCDLFVSPFWPVLSTLLVSVNGSSSYFLPTFSQSQTSCSSSPHSLLPQTALFSFLQVIIFSTLSSNWPAPSTHLASFQAISLTNHSVLVGFLPYANVILSLKLLIPNSTQSMPAIPFIAGIG